MSMELLTSLVGEKYIAKMILEDAGLMEARDNFRYCMTEMREMWYFDSVGGCSIIGKTYERYGCYYQLEDNKLKVEREIFYSSPKIQYLD